LIWFIINETTLSLAIATHRIFCSDVGAHERSARRDNLPVLLKRPRTEKTAAPSLSQLLKMDGGLFFFAAFILNRRKKRRLDVSGDRNWARGPDTERAQPQFRNCGLPGSRARVFCWELLWKYEIASLVLAFAAFGPFCFLLFTGVVCVGQITFRSGWAFWIGIGHAGTLISAILHLCRQKWRTSINRAAAATNEPAIAHLTGLFAGLLIMCYVTF
jgi:hypothetical protein